MAFLLNEKGRCFLVSLVPSSKAYFFWCTSFSGLPLKHVRGLKFVSALSPLSLIPAHGSFANK
jgi:hypothetical protein